MPRVPAREQQVSQSPIPGVRLRGVETPESLGAGVGQVIQQAGSELYQREAYYADRAAVVEAETKAGQAQLGIYQQMQKMRGKEASQAPDFAANEFGKVLDDLSKGLASDRQRQWFNEVIRHKVEALNRSALQHFNTENERFQEETFKANLQQSVDTARAFAESPMAVFAEKTRQEEEIKRRSTRLGYSGTPQEQDQITNAHSVTNREVITALVNKDKPGEAATWYEHLKGMEKSGGLQLTAQDRDIVEKSLAEGTARGKSRMLAEQLIGTHGIDTPEQRKAVLDGVKQITDDKVADLVRQRVEHEFSTIDQLNKARAEQTFLNASKMIEETWKSTNKPAREMIPVSMWNSLTPNEQHTLELKTERLRALVVTHDSQAWFKFKTMKDEDLAKLTPSKLMGDYLNHFDREHYDRALNEYNAAINVKAKKDKTPDEKFVSALTTRERIKNSFNLSGVAKDPKKLTTEEAIWFDRFESEADKALSKLPKDATPEQIDKVLSGLSDNLLKQKYRVDPGAFRFNKDVPAVGVPDVKDPRSIRVPMKEIPPDRQNALRGALKAAGLPVTEQAIEELEAKSRLKRSGVQP